jgi:hypothetical protein
MFTGKYMYIEATGQNPGDKANLLTPSVIPETRQVCWKFYYHMYGADIGSLNITKLIQFFRKIIVIKVNLEVFFSILKQECGLFTVKNWTF